MLIAPHRTHPQSRSVFPCNPGRLHIASTRPPPPSRPHKLNNHIIFLPFRCPEALRDLSFAPRPIDTFEEERTKKTMKAQLLLVVVAALLLATAARAQTPAPVVETVSMDDVTVGEL